MSTLTQEGVMAGYSDCGQEISRLAKAVQKFYEYQNFLNPNLAAQLLKTIWQVHGKPNWKNNLTLNNDLGNLSRLHLRTLHSALANQVFQVQERTVLYRNCYTTSNGELKLDEFHVPQSTTACKKYKAVMHTKMENHTPAAMYTFIVEKGVPLLPTLPLLIGQFGTLEEMEVLIPPFYLSTSLDFAVDEKKKCVILKLKENVDFLYSCQFSFFRINK